MRRRTGAVPVGELRLSLRAAEAPQHQRCSVVVEEIEGLLRVYKDGHVERFPVVPEVPCTWLPELEVISGDVVIDPSTRVWARLYAPIAPPRGKLPALVYFHGGGFCVGSAAWRCYHEFLAKVASRAGCLIMSVNYRLSLRTPSGRLRRRHRRREVDPAAGHPRPGTDSMVVEPLRLRKGLPRGDSAGATITHNVSLQIGSRLRGVVLIQPFFGGEARTSSESMAVPPGSALNLAASDAYWRLSRKACKADAAPYLVCIAETDILRDRDMDFCRAMKRAGNTVEAVMHAGVGHAFQVLNSSRVSQSRAQEMISQLRSFLRR
ncbi:unnamed protein product [Spirodela intermedia]|uniref:Alpha/beta hydrolase fold-3 domain-containing protein n=1 Tax=Spirodela intermedia TaxID=51605 RepID=A0A7I8J3M2_SPIIN|nr:unnamed protein product [Spirodela intermedia]CAA6664846.1 unnamed protein product [Spirodela intermedia]